MALIAPPSVTLRQKRIALVRPGPAVPDGDGGFTQADVPLDPPVVFGHITQATARDLERLTAGTVLSQASHVVTVPWHPDITTTTALLVENYPRADRRLNVVQVVNPDERDTTMVLLAAEVVS